jgi:hypothetical protein
MYIISYKSQNLEQYKNEHIYKQKYLNNPNDMLKYKYKQDQINTETDTFVSVRSAQSNKISSENINEGSCRKTFIPSIKKLSKRSSMFRQAKEKDLDDNDIKIITPIFDESEIKNIEKQRRQAGGRIKIKKTQNNKYGLYSNNLFTYEPALNIRSNVDPNVDQTISSNIQNYINFGIESLQDNQINDDNDFKVKINDVQGKTIKEIYDDITNDHRLELQQNMDDVDANDNRKDFIIGEKYGATRFDTYSVVPL